MPVENSLRVRSVVSLLLLDMLSALVLRLVVMLEGTVGGAIEPACP